MTLQQAVDQNKKDIDIATKQMRLDCVDWDLLQTRIIEGFREMIKEKIQKDMVRDRKTGQWEDSLSFRSAIYREILSELNEINKS